MGLRAAVSPQRLTDLADEIDTLLQRLRDTALEARGALERGDFDGMARAMERRDAFFQRAKPMLEELRVKSRVARENRGLAPGTAALDHAIERLGRTLYGIQASDALLFAGLDALRAHTVRELDRLKRQRGDGSGYGENPRTGHHLDLLR